MGGPYQSVHFEHPIPDLSKSFDIMCNPGTDIWEKPPSTHSFNAPIIYRTTSVSAFQSAKVTISADWRHKYDQGGLCLIINHSSGRKWVKTGIEFLNGQANISTVATDRWSDWSLTPVSAGGSTATIEMESASDGSLWVYSISSTNDNKTPLREITWWADLNQDTECWIGVYAAKPAPHDEKDELKVHFENFQISTD